MDNVLDEACCWLLSEIAGGAKVFRSEKSGGYLVQHVRSKKTTAVLGDTVESLLESGYLIDKLAESGSQQEYSTAVLTEKGKWVARSFEAARNKSFRRFPATCDTLNDVMVTLSERLIALSQSPQQKRDMILLVEEAIDQIKTRITIPFRDQVIFALMESMVQGEQRGNIDSL